MELAMHAEQNVSIAIGEGRLIVPSKSLVKAWLDTQIGSAPAAACVAVPRIGEVWPGHQSGGIYAGMMRGRDGGADYPLILLPGDNDDADWQTQMDWAKSVGGDLPYPEEQSMLFANLRERFKPEAYWSNKTYESNSACAWYQNFDYGDQNDLHKSVALRAVSVSRLINSVL
ncbi:DUF1566 domain-containing protein [Ralstonia pseudosolanacearum]|uniref:DUF1566 domain-containing protein n=1 Tax=Ralstonia pseudosolanacearum TaxID=1310165 RepID=UPI003EE33539